jgi:2',3'-cyclic-nucleotide 2'-phosphodiesterase / 3'-nucleotidase / 5'-nucleotidase
MEAKMKKLHRFAIIAGISVTLIGATLIGNILPSNIIVSKAANTEEVDLRFIFTTDIHGQLNSYDYEKGLDYSNGGIARAYDLIKRARTEKPKENSFTFDVGDILYDYTTEYIFAENQKEIQPIYKAIAMVGYDAITLGNHDFDYGYEYILNQLKGSGLMDKTIVSNVMDSKTDEYPFLENMLITRQLETKDGDKVEVTVGVIGETIPNLTEKTESYTGVLKTEDIVENVKKQSVKLKEAGADIVVVLAHSGIGPENPELNFKNVSYALTKIDEVDVILCGHEHSVFPTTNTSSPYLMLPGVDKHTFLVNGKNLVMANDRGRSIGLVDLTLEVSDGEVEIINRASEVRNVKGSDTKEDKTMSSLYGAWEAKFLQYSKDVIGEVENGKAIENFFGLIQDNTAIQLLGDAMRSHAIRFVNTDGIKYKDYPIISASRYHSSGANSYTDFINIKNEFTESNLAGIQPYNNYLILYTINGKQLKEWLEWSASAYEDTATNTKWTNETMNELMKSTKLKSLIKEEWLSNWGQFYVFDGINYNINPMMQARYDLSGNRISNSTRVTDITYNGEPVTDNTVFILAADKITKPSEANKGVENQAVFKKFYRGQSVLSGYIKTISKTGSILPTPDNNWKLQLQPSYKFIVRASKAAGDLAEQSLWYNNFIKSVSNYDYYIASYPEITEDKLAPNLILVPTITSATGTGFNVAINATDLSGIKTIKYLQGDYDLNYSSWNNAMNVKDNVFYAKENGIYSVYAEDNKGNKIVKKILIDNISDGVVAIPKVETYTNRKTAIKGTAEPGTTISISAKTGNYETVVDMNGNFSYELPAQPSGSEVIIYAKDEITNRVSGKLTLKVKRTGPNQPTVNSVYNNSATISGYLKDDDASAIAIIGDNVYVSKNGGKELYQKATEIYDQKKNIITTSVTQKDGKYSIVVPVLTVGSQIQIYNIDHINRVSRVVSTKVKDGGPYTPVVNEISNIERNLTGKVTSTKKNTIFDVYAKINGSTYHAKSDSDGYFQLEITKQLEVGQTIEVYATDMVSGKTRESLSRTIKVSDIESYISNDDSTLSIYEINNKDTEVYGNYYEADEEIYLAVYYPKASKKTNEFYEVTADSFGDFGFTLYDTMPAGTKVYALTRFDDGEIISVAMQEVIATLPIKPYLIEEITNTTKQVQVVTDEDCTVTISIGSKKYTSTKSEFDETLNAYVYTVEIGRNNSGTGIKVYAKNNVGYSPVYKNEIIKVAPDSPTVDDVYADSTKITGIIDVFDLIKPEDTSVVTDETTNEEVSQDVPVSDKDSKEQSKEESSDTKKKSLVEESGTVVYAKIGSKTYKGTIDDNGNFTIKIKKQKVGTKIYVWGSNESGRGPITTIVVKKEKKK